MRKLVITLLVLAALFVVADIGLRAYAESRTADAIAERTQAAVKPDVSIEGFPFLLGVLRGQYPQVVITDNRVAVAGVAGVRAVLSLNEVELPLADAIARDVSSLTAQSADLEARVPLASLQAALGRPNVTLAAGPDGSLVVAASVNVLGRDIPVSGTGTISVIDDQLSIGVTQFSAAGVDLTAAIGAAADALAQDLALSVPLRGLPFSVTGASATVEGDELVLAVSTGAFSISDLRPPG